MPNVAFPITFFNSPGARYKDEQALSLNQLAELIRYTQAESKDQLPWLKLARFGMVVTAKGSLRHDGNVLEVSGCEGDYDGEQVSFDEALERLQKSGVKSLVYTSPSHEPNRQRWRVLAPFSRPLNPSERTHMVARLNGVLGGVIADESFTLSQAYYFGHLVECPEFRVEVVDGTPIDECDELDTGAIGKSAASHSTGPGGNGGDGADLGELTRRILSGEQLHPAAVRLIGKMAADGFSRDVVAEYFSNLFLGAQQERYRGRWGEMLKIIGWVYEKEKAKNGIPGMGSGSSGFHAGHGPGQGSAGPSGGTGTGSAAGARPAGSAPWIKPGDWVSAPPPLPEYVVEGLIPRREVTLFSGHGAAGKSTVALHLCAACALGRTWLDVPVMAGPALFVDAEDEPGVMYQRLLAICKHYGCSLFDLDELYILSLAGQGTVMAGARRDGTIVETPLFKWLSNEASILRPVVISVASSANVYTGSEIERSQVTGFLNLLKGMAKTSDSGVVLVSHPSITGINSGSGISGNTAWHDSVRARMYLQSLKDGDEDDTSDLRKLEFMKNQYGKPAAAITLKWKDGLFLPEGGMSDYERAASEAKAENLFRDLLRRFIASGRHVSHKPKSPNYAPSQFAGEPEVKLAACKKSDLIGAMARLFQKGDIKVVPYGPKSDGTEEVVFS